jgi:YbbR domain-containing protein
MLERLLRNWPLKLLAGGLAFAIWIAITGENRILLDFKVPLEVALPADYLLSSTAPNAVTVRLAGPENILRTIDSYDLALRVDLWDASPGERNVQLSSSDMTGVPRGIEVVLIDPPRLTLTVAQRGRRSVPVVPTFVGKPPPGYALYGARVNPESLEVEGPEPEAASLTPIRTDPIHLEERTSPFTVQVRAVPDSPNVRVVNPRPLEVRAFVDVAPVEAKFDEVPVAFSGQAFEASTIPSMVSVTLSGPPAVLSKIRPTQVRAVADLTGLAPKPDPFHLPLRAELVGVPPDELARITIKTLSRETVEVLLSERKISR